MIYFTDSRCGRKVHPEKCPQVNASQRMVMVEIVRKGYTFAERSPDWRRTYRQITRTWEPQKQTGKSRSGAQSIETGERETGVKGKCECAVMHKNLKN